MIASSTEQPDGMPGAFWKPIYYVASEIAPHRKLSYHEASPGGLTSQENANLPRQSTIGTKPESPGTDLKAGNGHSQETLRDTMG